MRSGRPNWSVKMRMMFARRKAKVANLCRSFSKLI